MTMDVQTVFIGALMLCKPGVVDEIIPDLELDLFRPELRNAFAAVQGYWTARGKIDIVEINNHFLDFIRFKLKKCFVKLENHMKFIFIIY